MNSQNFNIDEEFKNVFSPQSEDQYRLLKENISREGLRDPLVVAELPDGTRMLADGHTRFQIWQELSDAEKTGKQLPTITMKFATREDVMKWIIRTQLGRRNLAPHSFDLFLAKLYDEEKRGVGERGPNLPDGASPTSTADRIGRKFGVSGSKVKYAKKYFDAVESIKVNVGQEAATEIEGNKVKLPRAKVIEIGNLPAEKQEEALAEAKAAAATPRNGAAPEAEKSIVDRMFEPFEKKLFQALERYKTDTLVQVKERMQGLLERVQATIAEASPNAEA